MTQPGDQFRLPLKTEAAAIGGKGAVEQYLDRHCLPGRTLPGAIHHALPATAEFHELIVSRDFRELSPVRSGLADLLKEPVGVDIPL